MRKVFAVLFLVYLIVVRVSAQSSYPIYVSPNLTPPYSLKLSDYSKFGSQQLVVNIAVNDLSVSNLPVKLHIRFETVGVTIENIPNLSTTPIYLDGGAASILFGDDLKDYFDINNLVFKGYSKEAYKRTGQLPEGFYKISVEVRHFQTNRLISNQGTASAWIAIGKPPLLKLPESNTEIGEFKGMPLVFSWYPINLGSPVSEGSVQYKFEMWELRVEGVSPYTVAATVPNFYEETTQNTMLSIIPASMLMTPGMKYAWRVTASDLSGFVPFEQDGHSEIRVFTYRSKCETAKNLKSKLRGTNGFFAWETARNHTSYNVELRKPETSWLSASETFDNKAEFFDLDYSTTYELRVQSVCDNDPSMVSDFTGWEKLKTPEKRTKPDSTSCPNCGCGDNAGAGTIENIELKRDLKAGDTLVNRFGTTRFILKSVEQTGDGVYKGQFYFWAEIWKLKFICDYWDLSANTDKVILNMDFLSVYNPQFLLDVDAATDYLNGLADALAVLTSSAKIKDTLGVNENVLSYYVSDNGELIAITVGGNGEYKEVVVKDDVDDVEETLIKGTNGEECVVTKNGEVMGPKEYKRTGGGNGRLIEKYIADNEKNNLTNDVQVNFSASQSQKYGFDAFSNEKETIKAKYPALGNGYIPAYKSVASFTMDKVVPNSTGNGITFRDQMGISAIKSGDELTIRGGADGTVTALYAYNAINDTTEKIAGKLNLMSFDEQAKKLYIVPVNGATLPNVTELQNLLNRIYAQAVTRWEVVKMDSIRVTFPNGGMTHGGSSAISVYNDDQKAVISKFKEIDNFESNAFYLFFVDNVKGKTGDVAGFMPLQRQAGFIYDSPNMFVIAHELAHGTFNLRHTFSPEELIATENTTQNLMDYKGGSDLWKHQWELIRDPENMLFAWAQDEREGEYVEEGPISEVARFINTIKCAKDKNLTSVVIHHAFNSYNVKVGDLLGKLNKYRSTNQTTVVSEEFKKAYLKVFIDGGLSSSATDLYFGYHNFQLTVNDYKRNPAQANKSEELIFSANGKPIIFSFPIGIDATIQKDVLDWLERECGITVGGKTFESIRFNVDTDNIKDLFSLSVCQLEQINKEDRKKLIEKTLENVENFFGLDKDTYQYLLSNLILSTPKPDVDDLIKYLSSIGGKLESTFLDLTTTAKEVYIYSLCELAKKSWGITQYLGDINSYYLGSLTLGSSYRQRFGICGTFNLQPGKYEFSYSGWVSDDGIFPSNEPNPQDVYELSAFDPVECNIISDNTKIESKQIMPAIVVKIYAINLHIANIDQLLSIPKMVILPTFSSAVFQGAKRLGQGTIILIKDITKTFAISTGNLLSKCGKLGYKIKLVGTEVALYTNLNIEIARFSNTGKLMANVYPYNKVGIRLLNFEDEIEYGINTSKTGKLELAKADDGVVFFRELFKGADWTKYVDDFFANAKVITSKNRILNKGLEKVYTQLSVEEITAIHHYTTGAYRDFNAALRAANGNISALDEFNRAFYEILQSGMQKMPNKFNGQLYRGTSLSEEALLKYKNAFQNKTGVTEYSYTSTSQGTDVYKKFQNLTKQEGDMPVLIFVNAKGKYGVDIDGISRYGKNFTELGGDLQSEVLYMSGAKFKVTEYVEDISTEGQKYVKMVWEEIP